MGTDMESAASERTASSPRRDEILEAATLLFAEQGYHAVGMRAIAESVGIRSSSLYHHFPSKQALLAAIASEYSHAFITAHLPILQGDAPPDERLRHVLRDQIVYFWHHRLQREVGLRGLRDLAADQPEAHQTIQTDLRTYQHAITDTIAEGAEAGLFDTDNPGLSARAVIGMIMSVNDWFRPGQRLSIEEVADVYAGLAVDRLLRAPSAS
jgi:TetR/AcrR family transcriptional regulator, cholesterol catabolism regulator